ncbi:MAG: DNA repair protein RecN [Neisseriaceae bacterium]|nr:MAG: DNA repair protein RecN [Neisseriaceae bacterium]
MLLNLQIRNFLLINELELDFENGLTVITGETGSGKSIIIDALMIIFGAKTNSEIIRQDHNSASFSATFEVNNPQIISWLTDANYVNEDDDNTIICRRVIDQNNRSKVYINNNMVTIGAMKELGDMLLDIHTQHASIALLKPDNQRILLDDFAKTTPEVNKLKELYNNINQLNEQIDTARKSSQDIMLKQEILTEKINDLIELDLANNEWENLQIEQKQLANASLILQELDYSLNALNNEHSSLSDTVLSIGSRLDKISDYLPTYTQISQLINSIDAELSELEHEIQHTANSIEQNPEQLAIVDARIDEIYTKARKYRIRPEDIVIQISQWQQELENLFAETDIEKLEAELATLQQEYKDIASKVSIIRKNTANTLSNQVTELLHKLAITGEFKIQIEQLPSPSMYGLDSIQYQICFNKGMQLQPLNKAASGGELSRVALALYVILSINNPPEIIVFDEIDVGIGGGVAEVVGTLLHDLGKSKQVICITHQPQTASCGNYHLLVSKHIDNGITASQIDYLNNKARINEIARMLGGLQITETTLKHAEEMLNNNDNS